MDILSAKITPEENCTPRTRTLLSHNGTNCSAPDLRRFTRLERSAATVTECLIIESSTDLLFYMITIICDFFEINITYFLDNT